MKIEDLTLKEIREICTEHNPKGECCIGNTCPIMENCLYLFGERVPSEWTTEGMERDIEGVNNNA